MKRILLTLVGGIGLAIATTTGACAFGLDSDWDIHVDVWAALGSMFDERPGPDASGHVWGEFDTMFYTLSVEKGLAAGLRLEGKIGTLAMLPNTMYLHDTQAYTRIDGTGYQLWGTLFYRLWESGRTHVDFGAGYQWVDALKHFYDRTVNGVVEAPGNWGNYAIQYGGLIYRLRGGYWPLQAVGLEVDVLGSPVLTNQTEVTGYPVPIHETATGLRYRLEGRVAYAVLPAATLSVGYRYEDIYFAPPKSDSFSLAIVYSGAFIDATWSF